MAKNIYEKIWDKHVVFQEEGAPPVIYIDLHLLHEVTSPQAFDGLRQRGIKVRRPDRTFATVDHVISTINQSCPLKDPIAQAMVVAIEANAKEFGIKYFGLDSGKQGIVHIIGPELGLTQPGKTIVIGDSHTSTHGALGALAFGIGTSEVEQVLATQCLFQKKSPTMNINITGKLEKGVTAKDLILYIINQIGAGGGTGHVIEYTGDAIENTNMAGRMTICNMTIEAGARSGIIAPDEVTFEYLKGREYAPKGEDWLEAVAEWKELRSDPDATYDKTIEVDASTITPWVTYGNSLDMSVSVDGQIPTVEGFSDDGDKQKMESAIEYMNLKPGQKVKDIEIQNVFIGSCTNGRIEDIRDAAKVIEGKKVASHVKAKVVPGSQQIKRMAEKEGLDKIFVEAGFEWREAGCSSCLNMNPDNIPAGEYCVSTSNRNFKGRQGKGSRTLLASPITAAASAIEGRVADPRKYI
ncbi:3-isopropylmalate dehydratase large subunit [Candidatus Dojkabacteria bacterium]|nr:3-isopropylmalate dehydratase large subunit [Candidatus Dojkabacteria bacterium]